MGEQPAEPVRGENQTDRLFGVEIQLDVSDKELMATTNNVIASLGRIIEKAGNDRNVLFLILDDINGLAEHPSVCPLAEKPGRRNK